MARTAGATDRAVRLRVDPVRCDGVGICAFLAPDVVSVDRWGYPVVDRVALTGSLARQAASAVAGCPRRALFVETVPDQPGR